MKKPIPYFRVSVYLDRDDYLSLKLLLVPKRQNFSSFVQEAVRQALKKSAPREQKKIVDTIAP